MSTKKVSPCEYCQVQNECAVNSWFLWNSHYPECPNYEEGLKQYKQFLKEEGYEKTHEDV